MVRSSVARAAAVSIMSPAGGHRTVLRMCNATRFRSHGNKPSSRLRALNSKPTLSRRLNFVELSDGADAELRRAIDNRCRCRRVCAWLNSLPRAARRSGKGRTPAVRVDGRRIDELDTCKAPPDGDRHREHRRTKPSEAQTEVCRCPAWRCVDSLLDSRPNIRDGVDAYGGRVDELVQSTPLEHFNRCATMKHPPANIINGCWHPSRAACAEVPIGARAYRYSLAS